MRIQLISGLLHHFRQQVPQGAGEPEPPLGLRQGLQLGPHLLLGSSRRFRQQTLEPTGLSWHRLTSQSRPISDHHRDHTTATTLEQALQCIQRFLVLERLQAHGLKATLQTGGHSRTCPRPPLNRQAHGGNSRTIQTSCFHSTIGGAVDQLARRSQSSRYRRENHFEVELLPGLRLLLLQHRQPLSDAPLGIQNKLQGLRINRLGALITQGSCCVYHAL